MVVSDDEVIRIAREMIKQHEDRAALAAVERLNQMIDQGDWRGRDVWARIVHAIHELQEATIANFGRARIGEDERGRLI
jgi:hypothetical protein